MKVFLVRHGETTGDIEDRYGGWYDDHLTTRGRAQIEATAACLIDKGIELIYSSSLIRAKEAAEIISQALRVPIEYVDGMRERNYGILCIAKRGNHRRSGKGSAASYSSYLSPYSVG